jgi:muramoyltetrapeptide carboxypeptidase
LANPKPFIGYSDNTTLLTWFADNGLVTFHGPMVIKDFGADGGVDPASWMAVLGSASGYESVFADQVEPLVPGRAEGTLYGGCLSLLVASLGTPHEIKTEGTILFLEDMNEKPYQIDRMLMQLKLAGKLEGVRGILFGEMLDCFQPNGQDYTLQQVVLRVLSDSKIPIAYGFPSGHVRSANRVLPLGVKATLEVTHEVRLAIDAAVTQGQGTPRIARERSPQ